MADRVLDEVERKLLRSLDVTVTREVRLPAVALEVVEDLARRHRDTHQPRNKGRQPATSWVVSLLLVEALVKRGLLTRAGGDGRLRIPGDIDDLL